MLFNIQLKKKGNVVITTKNGGQYCRKLLAVHIHDIRRRWWNSWQGHRQPNVNLSERLA